MRLVVARVERGEGFQVGTHVFLFQLLEERVDGLLVDGLLGELDALGRDLAVQRAELFVVRDVEEVDVLLQYS